MNVNRKLTTIPETGAVHGTRHIPREDEPLLGRPGDLKQSDRDSWVFNVVQGTGLIAQFGGILLIATIWSAIFNHRLIPFSAHPVCLSSWAILPVDLTMRE